jgi:hypothetical protein
VLNRKAAALELCAGVAAQMATARDARPEGGVGDTLQRRTHQLAGYDVLVEPQLPSRTEHTMKLRKCPLLVGHRTQDK